MHCSIDNGTGVAIDASPPLSDPACELDEPLPRLVSQLHAVLSDPRATAEERLRQANAMLGKLHGLHGLHGPYEEGAHGDRVALAGTTSVVRGGLAPWQVRCVKQYIERALGERLTGADLARRVKLSEHHFCRAFRVSLRQTPHNYVIGRRVERACGLMRSATLTIGQIALECGFADQAHFNKCFRKAFGTSPGLWRRAHNDGRERHRSPVVSDRHGAGPPQAGRSSEVGAP